MLCLGGSVSWTALEGRFLQDKQWGGESVPAAGAHPPTENTTTRQVQSGGNLLYSSTGPMADNLRGQKSIISCPYGMLKLFQWMIQRLRWDLFMDFKVKIIRLWIRIDLNPFPAF
jgi:hypothetical protein